MKKNIYVCVFLCLSYILMACEKTAVYTLKETGVDVEVSTKDFNPIDYLLKDGKPLQEKERKEVKTGTLFDINKLGTYTFTFPDYKLDLQIHIIDTQKPSLSIVGFSIKQGNVFTWNEESLLKLKAQASDNYDSGELVKKSLYCDSVDTTKIGKQTITCKIEDLSGNQATAQTEIEIIAGSPKEETQTTDIPEIIKKPKPIEGFD